MYGNLSFNVIIKRKKKDQYIRKKRKRFTWQTVVEKQNNKTLDSSVSQYCCDNDSIDATDAKEYEENSFQLLATRKTHDVSGFVFETFNDSPFARGVRYRCITLAQISSFDRSVMSTIIVKQTRLRQTSNSDLIGLRIWNKTLCRA